MRVFIDTNVWAAGIAGTGLCADLLDYVYQCHQPVLSEQVLLELAKALKKMRQPEATILAACQEARGFSVVLATPKKAQHRTRDPKDDAILQAALDAECDWLVSGDADLTVLKRVNRMPICNPRDFLEALGVEI